MDEQKLIDILNRVLEKKEKSGLKSLIPDHSLRKDLGFDSLDLAEMTVRIEDVFQVDVFADGNVDTIADIIQKLS